MKAIFHIFLALVLIAIVIALANIIFSFFAVIIGYLLSWLIRYLAFSLLCGALTWWLFDDFGIGSLIGFVLGIIYSIIHFIHSRKVPSKYSTSVPLTPYRDSSSNDEPSEPESYYSSNDNSIDKGKQERYEHYRIKAEDAYREYQYYKSKAEDAKSCAETEERYAEDYKYRYDQWGDELDYNSYLSCLSAAESYYSDVNQYCDEANRYYEIYENCKHKANCSRP